MGKSAKRERTRVVSVRLAPGECDLLTQAAGGAGLSTFLREAALADAEKGRGRVSTERARIDLLSRLILTLQPIALALTDLSRDVGGDASVVLVELLAETQVIRQSVIAAVDRRRR